MMSALLVRCNERRGDVSFLMLNEQQFCFIIFKFIHTGFNNHVGAKVFQNLILP